MSASLLSWIRPEILSASPYPLERIPEGALRLDAMENPFDLPPEIHQRLGEDLADLPLNRYPDGSAQELKNLLGPSLFGLPPDHLFLGNGSDEILLNLFLATPGPILLAEPTFSMYRIIANITARKVETVTLSPDLTLDMTALIAASKKVKPSLILLSHPNNPTGLELVEEEMRQLCKDFSGGILLDEAYYPFSRRTLLPLQREFPQLMILRTFSKMGLAALRLGILAADPKIVSELNKIRLPYNLDAMTQRAAVIICREFLPVLNEQVKWIVGLREELAASLRRLPGIEPLPSSANFLLVRVNGANSTEVYRQLAEHKIIIRDVSRQHPLLAGCLRITVGTREENEHLVSALELILKGLK